MCPTCGNRENNTDVRRCDKCGRIYCDRCAEHGCPGCGAGWVESTIIGYIE